MKPEVNSKTVVGSQQMTQKMKRTSHKRSPGIFSIPLSAWRDERWMRNRLIWRDEALAFDPSVKWFDGYVFIVCIRRSGRERGAGGGNTARDEVDGMRDVQMVGEREGHHAELYDS